MSNKAEARALAVRGLMRTPFPKEQQALRSQLREAGDDVLDALGAVYSQNPFLRLTEEEAAALASRVNPGAMGALIAARHQAMTPQARNPVVFCMPKSGSSFVQSALQHALQVPYVSLTSFGSPPLSSLFGMNAREQELDELALVKASLLAPQGFVAQVHTRYTPYLALQMDAFGLKPIVTVRNILDALVSYDEMMLQWREGKGAAGWISDGPFALPRGYPELAPDRRYRIIARSLGVWLIQFHLSWTRGVRQRFVSPLVIRYEEDVLDTARLVERLAAWTGLDEAQAARLTQFAENPDRQLSRLNVGKAGRGRERIPADARDFLIEYARDFADEIPADDIAYLLD